MTLDFPRAGRVGWRRFIPSWRLAVGSLATVGSLGILLGTLLFAVAWVTVDVPEENEVAAAQASIVYWNDGETEIARLGDTNRISVPLSSIPEHTRLVVLAAEDRSFYEHGGLSVSGLARAMWSNLTTGSVHGGSTITQQYTKNAYLTSEKTYSRKLKELVLSLKLESHSTKDQILEGYLNTIFFGRGTYGIQTASEAYFGKDASQLTLEESAVLASLVNAPGLYNPETQLDRLRVRYAYVLDGMVEEGWLTPAERDEAVASFPEILPRTDSQRYAGPTGHLLASVKEQLYAEGFTEAQVEAGGLRIVSTFDEQAQEAAERAVAELGPRTGTEGLRIGLAAVEPGTGEVKAMYGGSDYLTNSLNNATQATAQAGSTFKAFGLAAAVEAGIGLDSYWPGNSPHVVESWDDWEVPNYANNSYGRAITLLKATEQSVNTAYVEVEMAVSIAAVRRMALRTGIPSDTYGWDRTNTAAFVLGTPSPTSIDVASAYATFAARGVRAEPTVVRSVTSVDGAALWESDTTSVQVMDANTADVVNYALQSVARNGTGRPALGVGRPVAAKTGSTDDYEAAWFAGYTPQLATVVTFSKEDSEGLPISLAGTGGMPKFYGSGYPARVWTAFMRGALAGQPVVDFVRPEQFPTGPGMLSVPAPDPEPTEEAASPDGSDPVATDPQPPAGPSTAPGQPAPTTDPGTVVVAAPPGQSRGGGNAGG